MFDGVHLDLDDEVYIYEINKEEPSTYYNLYEVYKITDQSATVVNPVGRWSSSMSLNLVKEHKNDRRANLKVSLRKI